MNIAKNIGNYLLAAVFIIFGIIGLLDLVKPKGITGDMLTYMDLMGKCGYMKAIKVFEILGGILLLFPRTRAMGLCVLTPIAINIVLFELLIAKQPNIGIVILLLCIAGIYFEKEHFKGILQA